MDSQFLAFLGKTTVLGSVESGYTSRQASLAQIQCPGAIYTILADVGGTRINE